VGDTCIAKMAAFVGEKRRGNWASPESFFDGRGWDDADYPVPNEQVASAAAIRLYANWDEGDKEESRMFNALSKHRKAKLGFQLRKEQREKEQTAKDSEQTVGGE
jgi:hypothetical protein